MKAEGFSENAVKTAVKCCGHEVTRQAEKKEQNVMRQQSFITQDVIHC